MIQLEFFPKTENEELREELKRQSKAVENLRKGLFTRHTTLAKEQGLLQAQIDNLQMQILILEKYIKNHLENAKECNLGKIKNERS